MISRLSRLRIAPRASLVLAAALGLNAAAPAQQSPPAAAPAAPAYYTVTSLGAMELDENGAAQRYYQPVDINAAGQVVGSFVDWTAEPPESRAVVWPAAGSAAAPTFLPHPRADSTFSVAWAINGSGHAAGMSSAYGEAQSAVVWKEDGTTVDLGWPWVYDGYTMPSRATGINDAGVVAGSFSTPYGERGFVWRDANGNGALDAGEAAVLGLLRGSETDWGYTYTGEVNASGQVAGYSTIPGGQRAFVWKDGRMIDLGCLFTNETGGGSSQAASINDAGQVAGTSTVDRNHNRRAFLWRDANGNGASDAGEMADLGCLGAYTYTDQWGTPQSYAFSEAFDVNNGGQVVGVSTTPDAVQHAVLWENGAMVDLNDRIDPASGWELTGAIGINDRGEIVGDGYRNGVPHAIRLRPNRAPVAAADARSTDEDAALSGASLTGRTVIETVAVALVPPLPSSAR